MKIADVPVSESRSKTLAPTEAISGLVRYDAMCRAIAECHSVDEVKSLRDKARALEVYAQQALNTDAERKAAAVRIRAERRCGELLKEMKENGQRQQRGGDRRSTSCDTTLVHEPKLADLGISRDQSSKWQKLADIPLAEFEEELTETHSTPTTEGMLAKRQPPQPEFRINLNSLNAWGRVMDFDRLSLLKLEPADLLPAMTDSMRNDLRIAVPALISWLTRFTKGGRSGTN